MCKEMLDYGAELIIIDGAIDRKSIAAPGTSDAIILSTGAVLSRSMKKVIEETAHTVGLYRLPYIEDENARTMIEEHLDKEQMLILSGEKITVLDRKTGLGAGKFLDGEIKDDTEYIFVPGAFTQSVFADISPKKLKQVTFILKDPTKIFIDAVSWGQYKKKGLKVQVLENIKVAAITVNPSAPGGYAFDHEELLKGVQEAIPDVPVIDVML
jgi:hypothetical protein